MVIHMKINVKKLCVHIGQRYDFKYASTANSYGYTASHMG